MTPTAAWLRETRLRHSAPSGRPWSQEYVVDRINEWAEATGQVQDNGSPWRLYRPNYVGYEGSVEPTPWIARKLGVQRARAPRGRFRLGAGVGRSPTVLDIGGPVNLQLRPEPDHRPRLAPVRGRARSGRVVARTAGACGAARVAVLAALLPDAAARGPTPP